MAEPAAFKYRAFISYSHADSSWTKWLHRGLDRFRIDKDLVGRETTTGAIPKTLRPIFRDRDEFTAGQALSDQTLGALDESHALIVVCSPSAAKSLYVNEEIRLFKSRHPNRPVIPLIVDGKPGDAEAECFPHALKFKLDAEGKVTDEPIELLAADAREGADGKSLALAKVVAGLLAVSSDDIFRRAERERRRRGRMRTGIVAIFIGLLGLLGALAYFDYQKRQTLSEIQAIVAKYSAVDVGQTSVPGARQSLSEAVTAIAEGAWRDQRYARALELLKAGKPREAEPLLEAVAQDKKRLAERQGTEAAEAFRTLASISGISDPKKAREYYAEAAALDPDNVEGMLLNGWFQSTAGLTKAAEAAFKRVIGRAGENYDCELFYAHLGIGDIHVARNELTDGIAEYRVAGAIAAGLAQNDPQNGVWMFYCSLSLKKIGDAQVARGDPAEALKAYEMALEVDIGLNKANPNDAVWKREISVSRIKLGDLSGARRDFTKALEFYKERSRDQRGTGQIRSQK